METIGNYWQIAITKKQFSPFASISVSVELCGFLGVGEEVKSNYFSEVPPWPKLWDSVLWWPEFRPSSRVSKEKSKCGLSKCKWLRNSSGDGRRRRQCHTSGSERGDGREENRQNPINCFSRCRQAGGESRQEGRRKRKMLTEWPTRQQPVY